MKTFRLIGMALLAVVMCVNFASCSGDDEEPIKSDDGLITNQKQLMQIKMVDSEYTLTWDFTYDSKGRLISINKAEEYDGETDRDTANYIWGNNTIIAKYDNRTWTYYLNNNLVVKSIEIRDDDSWSKAFTYNSSNQLIAVQNTDTHGTYVDTTSDTYTWNNGRITKITHSEHSEEDVYEYTYSGKTCKGYFPLYPLDFDDAGIYCVHPELIGLRCSQLPDQVYIKDNYYDDYYNIEETSKYSYTFDKDGYVESCTEVYTAKHLSDNTTDTETTIYTFTWE